ncbi:MAG: hypothetical protein GY862_32475 [Gammaproteobacteria bacterium]|nr:hypothetical protein [Gammaproteobacteria bacterium]
MTTTRHKQTKQDPLEALKAGHLKSWVHNAGHTNDIEALRAICLEYSNWWNFTALPVINENGGFMSRDNSGSGETGGIDRADAFQERVNFAAGYIAQGRQGSRRLDTCFEMYDGDAVAAALVRRADANPTGNLAKNLFQYIGEERARECSNTLSDDLKGEAAEMRARAEKENAAFAMKHRIEQVT